MCVHLFACEQVLGERERVSTKQSNDQREESVCMYRAYIVTSEKVYDELGFKRCRPFVRFFYFFFFFSLGLFFPFLAFRIALFFSTINRILIPSFFFSFSLSITILPPGTMSHGSRNEDRSRVQLSDRLFHNW